MGLLRYLLFDIRYVFEGGYIDYYVIYCLTDGRRRLYRLLCYLLFDRRKTEVI